MARILVVDDDEPSRKFLTLLCAHLGHEVMEAANGGEALMLVRKHRPDLVVTDLLMPVLDGFDLVREIRGDHAVSETRVMFYTAAYVMSEARDLASVCGVTHMLLKPAGLTEIKAAVEAILAEPPACGVDVPSEEYGRRYRILLNEKLLKRSRDLELEVEERRRAEAALRESEERFRTLADSAPVLIWMVDSNGRGTYVNRAWAEFAGDMPAIIRDHGADWLAGLHPDDEDRCMEALGRALGERQMFEQEYRRRRGDGDYRWVLDRAAPRFTPDGEFLGLTGSCVDVTLHRQLQERLLHAQKMEGLGRMASSVAHDFNNYLTAIGGYAELVATTPTTPVIAVEYAERILQAASGASELVRDLLAFARRQPAKKTLIDMSIVLVEIAPILERLAGNGVCLDIRSDSVSGRVEADAAQIDQVLMNLTVNACDAMDGCGTLTIVAAEAFVDDETARRHDGTVPGEYITIAVSDTGPGIPESVLPHLFEPFFTTKEIGRGTGLGLSTCYGIVRQSGGFISVATQQGRGSTFTVYLPVVHTTDVAGGESALMQNPVRWRG